MSRNSRHSRRRSLAAQRLNGKSWLRRYMRALRSGVAVASIGALGLCGGQSAEANNAVWIGNSSVNFADPVNWSTNPIAPLTLDTLTFGAAGTAGTTLTDNLMTPATYSIAGITYNAGAAGFTINPATVGTNGFALTGTITNSSTNTQTINDNIVTTAVRTIVADPGSTLVLGGANSGTGGGYLKQGNGALTFAGTNTWTGGLTINAGTVNVSGSVGTLNNPFPLPGTTVASVNSGALLVGNLTGSTAVVNVTGGNLTPSTIAVGGVTANYTAANSGASGAIYQSGGVVNTTAGASTAVMQLGAGVGGYGYYKLSGGTLISNEIGIGGANLGANNASGVGVMDITGGTFYENGWVTMTRGAGGGEIGILNMTGGTLNAGTDTSIGGRIAMGGGTVPTTAVITLTNGAQIIGPANTGYGMFLSDGGGAGSLGVLNLNSNGMMTIGRVTSGTAGTITFVNFNGGTLRASTDNTANFMTSANVTGINILSGGATIDNNGKNIIITNPLLAPAGQGGISAAVADGGSGYIGAPAVTFSGGTGSGMTGTATVVNGVVTGITITSPGTGYSPGDFITAAFTGGGATVPATPGAVTLGANVSGGVTFDGAGITTLGTTNGGTANNGGVSTYTGPTVVKKGTIILSGAANLSGTSSITLGSATDSATFVATTTAPVTAPITLTRGTVDGTATLSSLSVASLASNVLANGGNGTSSAATTLNIGNLTLAGATTLKPVTSLATALSNSSIATTSLTVNGGATSLKVQPANADGFWTAATYHLVGYSGTIAGTGAGFGAFDLDRSQMGLGARQLANLANNAGFVDLVVSGDTIVYTGTGVGGEAGVWSTATQGAPKNWKLAIAGTATDYLESAGVGDVVAFNDTATGPTNVTIGPNDVAPALISVNNSAQNYTFSGTKGIIGNGVITKDGTGSLTINTPNSFTGGVKFNSGTLNLGTPSAIGSGRLTVGLNTTLDNTSGAALTLSANNPVTINGDFTFSGSNNLTFGSGAVTVNANAGNVTAGRTTINVAAKTLTFGGAATFPGSLNKTGTGTLSFNGGGTVPGQSTVLGGILRIAAPAGVVMNFSNTNAPALSAGFQPNAQSAIKVDSGTLTTGNEIWLGSDTGTYGALTMNGGAVNVGSWFALGRSTTGQTAGQGFAGVGLANINGGTLTVQSNRVTIGSFGLTGGIGQISVRSGGTLATTGSAGIFVGEWFPGYLNVLGNGATQAEVNIANSSNLGLQMAVNGQVGTAVLNLGTIGGGITNNGRITTNDVLGGAATEIFNFHGGTLRSNANGLGAAFMDTLASAIVWGEGAVFDTQANTNIIAQVLSAPTGQGVTATGLTASGTGFIDTPFVQITGGGGTGATANATVDANGNLTGIVMTNPGTGYTSAPTFTLIGGGSASSGSITGTATLVANGAGGGLIKQGTGTLALAANNTYTGGTTITAGTIAINSAAALGTGTLTINAGGIDNTTANTITSANAQTWNADFAYGGTRNLNLTGAISLGTTAGTTRILTTNATTAGTALTIANTISNGTTANSLTKAGAGTLIMTGTAAYTGATTVTAGTFTLQGAGSINSSTGLTLNGASAILRQNSSVALSKPVTVTLGGIDGTGTISGPVTVAAAAANAISHGNGTQAPITINSLSFAGAATVNVTTSCRTL